MLPRTMGNFRYRALCFLSCLLFCLPLEICCSTDLKNCKKAVEEGGGAIVDLSLSFQSSFYIQPYISMHCVAKPESHMIELGIFVYAWHRCC